MKQIQITERDVVDLARARGSLLAARFNLDEVTRRVLEAHGVQPEEIVAFEGDVITVKEAADA